MITHNITIYPNGNMIDEIIVRQWDNLSHKMVFTLPPQVAQTSGITADLRVLPNGAKGPYIYPCEINGSEAACTPTYEAWAWQGIAHMQLAVYSGGSILWQSSRMPVTVQGSIDLTSGTTPEEGKTLIQELEEALAKATGIINFQAEAFPLPPYSDPTVERIIAPGSGQTTLRFGLVEGKQGEKGEKGERGKGFEILGYYGNAQDLEAIPDPKAGDAYGIGTESPYSIFVWDAISQMWVDNGPIATEPYKVYLADETLVLPAAMAVIVDEELFI